MRQRVIIPLDGATVCRSAIAVDEYVQPEAHASVPPEGGGSALPIVTSACAAGASASTRPTVTSTPLIAPTISETCAADYAAPP
jgi:hypothetical protein